MTRYVIHPGVVTSRRDGDRHYIDVGQLCRLYGISAGRHHVVTYSRFGFRETPNDVHLYPRFDGNYQPVEP